MRASKHRRLPACIGGSFRGLSNQFSSLLRKNELSLAIPMGKILVVDDDPELQTLIRSSLESDGHTVLQAMEPDVALAALDREAVDLVITDFMMPKMNGVEFLERLRLRHPDLKC